MAAPQNNKNSKPNIVYILIDDMGWKDLGCFGAKLYETPHIDKLCSEGIRFSQAYTSAPICAPARATSLTGKHPMKLKMWDHTHYIQPDETILPQHLNQNGYQTWHVGKWHIGNSEDRTLPTDLGFDVNVGGGISWGPGSYFWPYGCNEDGTPKNPRNAVPGLFEGGRVGEYLTDRITDEALKLIDRRDSSKPFFLNLWHHAVHNEKEGKTDLVEKYRQKIKKMGLTPTYRVDPKTGTKLMTSETNPVYAAMLESVDDSVGRVVEKIKEIGEYQNTLFIFYSDNGCTTDDVPCVPLNGGKNTNYEGGDRVPAFITWINGNIQAREYHQPVYIGDIFDTVIEATNTKISNGHKSDSMSLLPIFQGNQLPARKIIWYFPDERLMYAGRANAAIYDEQSGLKYLLYFNGDRDEVFNIHHDLGEEHDILGQHPELEKQLREELITFLREHYKYMPPPPQRFEAGVSKRLNDDLYR